MSETILKFADVSREKILMLNNNFIRYFIMSMLAGIYVGFGVILVFSIAAPFQAEGLPFVKLLMGASFAIALTLVIFAGAELFTGNNMVMVIGSLTKKVTLVDTLKIFIVSYIGNLTGALLLALAMRGSGLITTGALHNFILSATADKMNAPFDQLFIRGIICNILVCLGVWTAMRTKDDTAKLILIFWCLFGFVGAGFEHSVANMTLFAMGLFTNYDGQLISWIGSINNLIPVTLGNIVGGGLVGAAYWLVSKESKVTEKQINFNIENNSINAK